MLALTGLVTLLIGLPMLVGLAALAPVALGVPILAVMAFHFALSRLDHNLRSGKWGNGGMPISISIALHRRRAFGRLAGGVGRAG
jgi:hypothetical protein